MATDPIVCDCGGSTRLKRILASGFGDMPKLLDVQDLSGIVAGGQTLPSGTAGSQATVPSGGTPFQTITLMFQDSAGTPFTSVTPVSPNGFSFLINSDLGQNVSGDFDAARANLTITIFGNPNGADPLVEAKQLRAGASKNGRRRYIVANAGPILTVFIGATKVYDATGVNSSRPPQAPRAVGPAGRQAAPANGLPLYVSVVVS